MVQCEISCSVQYIQCWAFTSGVWDVALRDWVVAYMLVSLMVVTNFSLHRRVETTLMSFITKTLEEAEPMVRG
jgi:hypothetical protein